jgi:hypothetical protein
MQWITILVSVDREIWQGIAAHGLQNSVGILRDHLDVAIEQDPVSGQGIVTIAQCVPAMMRLRILPDRDNAERRRIRVDADVGPLMERPRVGGTSSHPALLTNYLGSQLECQTGKGCARLAMVGTVYAVVLPDDCLDLSGGLTVGKPEVVSGDIDDGQAQHYIRRRRRLHGVLECQQLNRHASWRGYFSCHFRDEGEPCYCPARTEAYKRSRLLPPGLSSGRQQAHLFPDRTGNFGTAQISV